MKSLLVLKLPFHGFAGCCCCTHPGRLPWHVPASWYFLHSQSSRYQKLTLSHNLPLSSRSCISMFFFFPYLWTQLPFSHCIPGWEPGKRMLLAGSSELPAHSHRDCRQGSCVEDAKKTWVNGNWGEHLREGPSECIRDENFVELCSQVTAKTWAQHSRQGWEYLL